MYLCNNCEYTAKVDFLILSFLVAFYFLLYFNIAVITLSAINNAMKKFPIHFTSHMCIVGKIMNIIHIFTPDRCAYKH